MRVGVGPRMERSDRRVVVRSMACLWRVSESGGRRMVMMYGTVMERKWADFSANGLNSGFYFRGTSHSPQARQAERAASFGATSEQCFL